MPKPLDRRYRDRESEPNRIRGRRAVALRLERLAAEPLCRDCKAKGLDTLATVPDHIVPLAHGGTEDPSNIRCLCERCHQDRTCEQFGLRKKARVDDDGWPL